jgi:hypothetical protein
MKSMKSNRKRETGPIKNQIERQKTDRPKPKKTKNQKNQKTKKTHLPHARRRRAPLPQRPRDRVAAVRPLRLPEPAPLERSHRGEGRVERGRVARVRAFHSRRERVDAAAAESPPRLRAIPSFKATSGWSS